MTGFKYRHRQSLHEAVMTTPLYRGGMRSLNSMRSGSIIGRRRIPNQSSAPSDQSPSRCHCDRRSPWTRSRSTFITPGGCAGRRRVLYRSFIRLTFVRVGLARPSAAGLFFGRFLFRMRLCAAQAGGSAAWAARASFARQPMRLWPIRIAPGSAPRRCRRRIVAIETPSSAAICPTLRIRLPSRAVGREGNGLFRPSDRTRASSAVVSMDHP